MGPSRRKITAFAHAVYRRIVLTRTTTFFFVFSLLYCFTQGIIQSFLYSADNEHRNLLDAIVRPVLPAGNMTFVQGSPGNFHLQMCNDVPYVLITGEKQDPYPCTTIFLSSENAAGGSRPSGYDKTRTFDWELGLIVDPVVQLNEDNQFIVDGIQIHVNADQSIVSLSHRCVQTLSYPRQVMTDARREDLALIAMHFWLFAISMIGVVNDSVAHLLTVTISRVTLSAWAAFSVWRTTRDMQLYQELLAEPGTPCSLDLLSEYLRRRLDLQIADLVLSVTALGVFLYLIVKLVMAYNSQVFRCVGAPKHINRINKFFLALLSCLQLEAFVLATGMAMWVDVLLNTAIGKVTPLMKTYIAVFITTTLVLLPWIITGWIASKREKRRTMIVFLFIGFLILLAWLVMFYSIVYRWTFLQWPFIGCFTVASLVLLVASFVLGVVCRLYFGKGHAEYLRAEEALSALNFSREVFTRNENDDSFDLSDKSGDKRVQSPISEKDPFDSIYIHYIQTLESDNGGGITEYPPTKNTPFGRV